MANIWEKAISILAGNLNLGRSYLITTVSTCKRRNRFFPSTATNNSFISLYILKHFSAQSVSVSIICWALFQIFISTPWNAIVKKEGIPTLRGFVGSTLMTFEGLNSPRGYSRLRTELNKNSKPLKMSTTAWKVGSKSPQFEILEIVHTYTQIFQKIYILQ